MIYTSFFTNRVANVWNSFSNYVISATDFITSGRIRTSLMNFVWKFTALETKVKWYLRQAQRHIACTWIYSTP